MLISNQNEEYSLGIKPMDTTHYEFIALVNLLAEADASRFQQLFIELVAHTEKHFDAENAWMKESSFPAIAEHMAEHRRVFADLKQMEQRVKKGSTTLAKAFIFEHVAAWFSLHASTMDAALAAHMKSVGMEA